MKIHSLYFLALFAILFVSCKKDEEDKESEDIALIRMDQQYGTDPQQKFDIFIPEGHIAGNTPVLFLIHGGGWRSGNKNEYSSTIETYRALFPNHALVTVDYRLYNAGANKFPVQEQDVKACIEYVMIHSTDYEISQKFGIIGFNEGGHLGLLYAYKYGSSSYMPKVVADWNGQTDLIKAYTQNSSQVVKGWISDVAGNVATADSLTYISSSPLRYVSTNSPPTIVVQGLSDTVTLSSQSQMLVDKLQQTGIAHSYKDYGVEGHNFSPLGTDNARTQIQLFINTYLP